MPPWICRFKIFFRCWFWKLKRFRNGFRSWWDRWIWLDEYAQVERNHTWMIQNPTDFNANFYRLPQKTTKVYRKNDDLLVAKLCLGKLWIFLASITIDYHVGFQNILWLTLIDKHGIVWYIERIHRFLKVKAWISIVNCCFRDRIACAESCFPQNHIIYHWF